MEAAQLIQFVSVYALPLVFALAYHEAGHAYAAHYLGDPTQARSGRLTLNPFPHLDPIGSVLIPLIGLLSTAGMPGGPYLLGYAKTMIGPSRYFRHPRRDAILVTVAGPAANLLQALVWAVFAIALTALGNEERFFTAVARAGIQLNLVFTAFNLFPVPPLDGGKILRELLPWNASQTLGRIEPFGFYIIMALAFTGVLSTIWMAPLMSLGYAFISLTTYPLRALLL